MDKVIKAVVIGILTVIVSALSQELVNWHNWGAWLPDYAFGLRRI